MKAIGTIAITATLVTQSVAILNCGMGTRPVATGLAYGPAYSDAGSASQPYLAGAREGPESTSCLGRNRPSRCTKEALAALKSIPKLNYECGHEPGEQLMESDSRRAALRAYSKKIELAARASWWAASVDDLNGCAITHEARALTDRERQDPPFDTLVLGDESTRLVVVPDRCFSEFTRNVFLLQHTGGRVYATQVVDALEMKLCLEMQFARQNGDRLVIVKTHDAIAPFPSMCATYAVFSIDPRTHHAVPRKLFMANGKLTNEFQFDEYLLEDEETEKRWHAPDLVHNGTLAPRFYVYTLSERQHRDAGAASRLSRKTYVWNGKYYALQ